jgi:hypothetical protein
VWRTKLQTKGTIFKKQTQILGYAYDIDIIGRSQAAAREAFIALEREANKVGLRINVIKTKCMIAAENDGTIQDVGQSVAFAGSLVLTRKKFAWKTFARKTYAQRPGGVGAFTFEISRQIYLFFKLGLSD